MLTKRQRIIRKRIRESISARTGGRCFWCGRVFEKGNLTIEHLFPLTYGGIEGQPNIVVSCLSCNVMKGALPPMFFARHREEIERAYEDERLIFQNLVRQA